jgi:hypothetical protein
MLPDFVLVHVLLLVLDKRILYSSGTVIRPIGCRGADRFFGLEWNR